MYYGTNTPPALTGSTCPATVGNIMHRLYNFSLGSSDNGNALSITNCRDTTRSESVTYDALNRISSAQSSGSQWGETFNIDAWGNLTNETGISGKTNSEGLNAAPATTQNQLPGFGYDAAGNMTSNTAINATYVYDAENRLIWTSGYRYVYDGDGKRVEKCVAATSTTACPTSGTNGTLYWAGIGSDTLDESDLSGNPQEEYVFFNGQRIARRDVTSTGATIAVHYYFSDHLGSHSVITNAGGTAIEQDIDYYPYGGVEHDYCTSCVAQNYKFTGKERDTESGLDNFGARFDASSLGRFMSPDAGAFHFDNPQSFNRYAYTSNGPLRYVDPDGNEAISGQLIYQLTSFNAWAAPLVTQMAWDAEHPKGAVLMNPSGRLANDLHILNLSSGDPFSDAELYGQQALARMDIVSLEVEALATKVLAQLGNWANLGSTTSQEVGDAYSEIDIREKDRLTTKVKETADKAHEWSTAVGLIPGLREYAEGGARLSGAAHAGAEIAAGEQDFVTQEALDILKAAKKNKKNNVRCPSGGDHESNATQGSTQNCE